MFVVAVLFLLLSVTILFTFVSEPKELGLEIEDDHI